MNRPGQRALCLAHLAHLAHLARALGATLCLAVGALALAAPVSSPSVSTPVPQPPPPADCVAPQPPGQETGWQTLAPGIHVWHPAPGQEVGPANGGHVLPTTVIEDQGQAWVIDPGPSLQTARHLQRTIACRWHARVVAVFNSHAHPENVLGNSAFAAPPGQQGPTIWATAGTAHAMAQRCDGCLADLTRRAGAAALAGTTIVLPNRILTPGAVLHLGRHSLQVQEYRNAHTESDLVLWEPTRRIAWVGGLVYDQRLPELAQGSLRGWLQALQQLRYLQPRWLVGTVVSAAPPSQFPNASPALAHTASYLRALEDGVVRAMNEGRQAADFTTLHLPAYAHWTGYAERQGFNVQRAWRELEPLWMDGVFDASAREQVGR